MKNNKLFALIGSLILITSLSGCGSTGAGRVDYGQVFGDNDYKVASVTLNESDVTMDIGDTVTLTPTISYVDDQEVEVATSWRTSNARVAEVENGVVTAKATGTAYITYLAGIKSAGCKIVVAGGVDPVEPPVIPGTEFVITLSAESRTLLVGESFTLEATTSEEATITWNNSDPSVASFNNNGLVTALSLGSTTISASANDKVAKCVVNVVDNSGGEEDEDKEVEIYFFLDYNNVDDEDETGTKLIKKFNWYGDKPLSESGLVPTDPTNYSDPAFPYFIGWSAHTIIDSKVDLWDMSKDTVYERAGYTYYLYLYGIWSDVTKEAFTK